MTTENSTYTLSRNSASPLKLLSQVWFFLRPNHTNDSYPGLSAPETQAFVPWFGRICMWGQSWSSVLRVTSGASSTAFWRVLNDSSHCAGNRVDLGALVAGQDTQLPVSIAANLQQMLPGLAIENGIIGMDINACWLAFGAPVWILIIPLDHKASFLKVQIPW